MYSSSMPAADSCVVFLDNWYMRPFSLLIKPCGPDCNLQCRYCFYLDRNCMFAEGAHRMGDEVLEKMVNDYVGLNLAVSNFAWQGGEPTLMGLDFYKKVIELQKKAGKDGQLICNALQTNGILLDDDWCKFLNEYQWLTGISLDGPKKFHDYYRLNKAGNGTYDRVAGSIEKCKEHKVEFNILTLLNDKNVKEPDELFDFFTGMGIKYLQFIPCVERDSAGNGIASFSVSPDEFGDFLCKIFDRWLEYGPAELSVRIFDSLLSYIVHRRHTNCTFGQRCDDYIVIEHNGDAFCCDFFVEEEYRLGNVLDTPIDKLMNSKTKTQFARQKSDINTKCLICRHSEICRGGCLKDRIVTNNRFSDVSYFCGAYKRLFEHAVPKLSQIAAEIVRR